MTSLIGVTHRDPEILSGTPVFVGTRVPVRSLFDYLEGGDTLEEFLHQFPSVTRASAGPELAAQIESHRRQLERTLELVDHLTAAAQADRSLLAPRLDEAARGRRMQAAYAASGNY